MFEMESSTISGEEIVMGLLVELDEEIGDLDDRLHEEGVTTSLIVEITDLRNRITDLIPGYADMPDFKRLLAAITQLDKEAQKKTSELN